ncbi:acetyl/propionyl/methylcrotonyl-CoA carboxylase subunit alpha [Rhodoblastus sp.]|uniref:acetyl/propionyl/methylcrotonyl-CoA carboxylase subunit alpha n=1 Tax=Rhodoblastus sp. TaxID=1962975 RepID=UPI003F9C2919
MFDRILIANRGEIACRIIRTARKMGVGTVAVFSTADAGARHVRLADESVFIGASEPKESYLAIDKIVAAALRTGAQAIHPGYGFLSENARFRRACDDAGLVFIGPPLGALEKMGSKSQAKKLMAAAQVPLTPGYHGDDQDAARLQTEADAIGYPVLIKASAGGGGKGMRRVDRRLDFADALASCKREAAASFSDDHVLIEKYIERPRHVEIQIFADGFGECVSLFERDCSTQRRHQKIIEEAPAPGMSDELRRRMGEAAVAAARAVAYVGAGTVEFILAPNGEFFFMEMNTRLQVEHPVTEFITGIDLVEWQLRVAAGEKLPLRREQIMIGGHALEARIYAEDPAREFLPSTGILRHLRIPEQSEFVRVDAGADQGDSISPYYDPMIAKLIVHDENREKALLRMRRALVEFEIVGVATNVEFLSRLFACPAFVEAELDTGLIERERAFLFPEEQAPPDEVFFIAALAVLVSEADLERANPPAGNDLRSPWNARDGWRLNLADPRILVFEQGGQRVEVAIAYRGKHFDLSLAGGGISVAKARREADGRLELDLDGVVQRVTAIATGACWRIFCAGRSWAVTHVDPLETRRAEAASHGGLTAPMPGRVIALLTEAGARVEKGAPLMILEAMKMEHRIAAPSEGAVRRFFFAVGDQVTEGAELLEFEPAEKA